MPIENEQFSNATFLLSQKSKVEEINISKLRSLNNPIARICAINSGSTDASKADSDIAKGLEFQILLAKGAHVMFRTNLCVKVGLVNGVIKVVYDILFEKDQGPPSLSVTVFIEFVNY
ncbi:28984_t:CDS:1, partial [Racocetra persica]